MVGAIWRRGSSPMASCSEEVEMSREIAREFRDAARCAVAEPLGPPETRPTPQREPPLGPWSVERAYTYCEELVRARAGTFPFGSRLVRAEIRPHLLALYAFARSADDFADDAEYEGRRVEALDHWEEQLRRSCHGEATHPVFVALADTITRRNLPIPPLEALGSDLRLELSVICQAATTVLDKIEAADFDVFVQRSPSRRREEALAVARNAQSWASLWLRRGAISRRGPSFA